MIEITPAQRRGLRAQAHHLNPVVSISQKGLQPSVISEIDRCLAAHELIKVRLYGIERGNRDALIIDLCGQLACACVQHIGNLLVLWRPATNQTNLGSSASLTPPRRPRTGKPLTKKQAAEGSASRGRPVASRSSGSRRRSGSTG